MPLKMSWTLFALIMLAESTVHASSVNTSHWEVYPKVSADINGTMNYRYNPETTMGDFNLSNTPFLLATGSTPAQEFSVTLPSTPGIRTQQISFHLDQQGQIIAGAPSSYTLYGEVTLHGQTFSGALLQGNPAGFTAQYLGTGRSQASSIFDIQVDITGGLLAPFFGSKIDVLIKPQLASTFTGSFAQSFSALKASSVTTGLQPLETFPVPEPSSMALFLMIASFRFLKTWRVQSKPTLKQ